jgi:hypothetical protein
MAHDQKLDVLGAVVAGKLGQHVQHLAQQQVYQRGGHEPTAWQMLTGLTAHKLARQATKPHLRAPGIALPQRRRG